MYENPIFRVAVSLGPYSIVSDLDFMYELGHLLSLITILQPQNSAKDKKLRVPHM